MRLILTGTKDKLAVPIEKDLALPDWDNAYLEWVDLSGLKLPPMRDADVYHYYAKGTIFGDVNYTQFRFTVDADGKDALPWDTMEGAELGNFSSYHFDQVPVVAWRSYQKLTGVPREVARIIWEYYLEEPYDRSWQDTHYRVMKELGISVEEAYQAAMKVFEGYTHLQSRLRWHRDRESVHPKPPKVETERVSFEIDSQITEVDTKGWAQFLGTDRYQAEQIVLAAFKTDYGIESVRCHIYQLHPYLVMTAYPERMITSLGDKWWQARWSA